MNCSVEICGKDWLPVQKRIAKALGVPNGNITSIACEAI